jgi:hypothetical protein
MSDAWRYADPAKLADPEAVRLLLQAVGHPAGDST